MGSASGTWLCFAFRHVSVLASILGVSLSAFAQNNVVEGSGVVVGADIQHVNGNVYDQVLMTGRTVTVRADPGQVVRVSFVDISNDIVQVEFSGPGNIAIEHDENSYSPPAPPLFYNQPGIQYVRGHPRLRIVGSTGDTYLSVFSVGTHTAINQDLFPKGQVYDAMADVRLLEIEGLEMGGVFAGNVRFTGSTSATGISAPRTAVRHRVAVGDLSANGDAAPLLRLGHGSVLDWDQGALLVAGGTLRQANGSPIDATSSTGQSLVQINAVNGQRSNGETVSAGVINAAFASRVPGTIFLNSAARTTTPYLPTSFNAFLGQGGIDTLDFGTITGLQFSGGNSGNYSLDVTEQVDGQTLRMRLFGTYLYEVTPSNPNRMTFAMTLNSVTATLQGQSFSFTIQQLAALSGTPQPTRLAITAEYDSIASGTATVTVDYTNGTQTSDSSAFDYDNPVNFPVF